MIQTIFDGCLFRCLQVQKFYPSVNYSIATNSVQRIMKLWIDKFKQCNVPEPESSIKIIVSSVLHTKNLDELDRCDFGSLTEEETENINKCCECRLARVPIQYIIKEWDFRECKLKMRPPVFIPRPETEQLIDIIKENSNSDNLKNVLEIGCGTGAISISLLKECPEIMVTAIDQSEYACQLTKENAVLNSVDDRLNVYRQKLKEGKPLDISDTVYDAIVSNPPYVFTSEIPTLEDEIKLYEDLRALDGGADGLKIIKAILKFASTNLKDDSLCYLEVHHRHVPMIGKWLQTNDNLKLNLYKSYKDFAGFDRFVCIRKNSTIGSFNKRAKIRSG